MKTIATTILSTSLLFLRPQYSFSDELLVAPWSNEVSYSVVKSGTGAVPKPGDLVAIRFIGSYKGNIFDNTFATEEPYLYRCGVGR